MEMNLYLKVNSRDGSMIRYVRKYAIQLPEME